MKNQPLWFNRPDEAEDTQPTTIEPTRTSTPKYDVEGNVKFLLKMPWDFIVLFWEGLMLPFTHKNPYGPRTEYGGDPGLMKDPGYTKDPGVYKDPSILKDPKTWS